MFEILIHCPLFLHLDADQIGRLFSDIHYQIKKYKKDKLIVLSGDEIIAQLIVMEGSVKGEMIDFSGKTIKIEDIPAPRPLAPAFLFGRNNKYPVNIVANEDVSILVIPKSSFVRLMQMNDKVLDNFLNIVSNRAQFLSNKIKFLTFQSIKGKFANYLLQHATEGQLEIVLDKTQEQLAELFGVARPSLARAISEMRDEGIIEVKAKKIRIIDRGRLSSLLK